MKDDIILNKTETIRKCIKRVKEEYQDNPENLNDYKTLDSIILNIQRLCEASIDIAMHYIKQKRLEIPQSSKETFKILEKNGILTPELSNRMQAMVGFRNIAIHDYQSLNMAVVRAIIEKHLEDSLELAACIMNEKA